MIPWWNLIPASAFLLVLMTGIWAASLFLRNAGIVDVAWAAGFAPLSWIYLISNPNYGPRQILFVGMVSLWAFRLAGYLGRRFMAHHPVEDGRYAALRQRWGQEAEFKMLSFFYIQALLMLVLSIPFLIVISSPTITFSLGDMTGLVVWIVALAGEALADDQLRKFKADPKNRGGVCAIGLWRYSRHPNYFFEWLVWVSYFLYALSSPWGWTTFFAPVLMLYFLTCLTGVKATEEQALKTKGDAYRRYQQATSAFVPWFPKTL